MKPQSINPVIKVLLVGWSAVYLLYAMLGVWLTTGPAALDSRTRPDTLGDNIMSGVWILLSVMQLIIAVVLNRHYKPWLFWVAITLAILSAGMFIGPILILSVSNNS